MIKHFEESQMKDTTHWMLNYRLAPCTICMAICKFHYLQRNDSESAGSMLTGAGEDSRIVGATFRTPPHYAERTCSL